MNLIEWPVHRFGLPLLAPYSLKRQSNILRTEMASGRARQRRISRNVPTRMQAEWLLPNKLRNDFIGFIDYALSGGVVRFMMPVRVGDQMIDHECTFVTHPADDEKPDGVNTRFKCSIEIRQLFKSSDEQVVADNLDPITLGEFVSDAKMHRYYKS